MLNTIKDFIGQNWLSTSISILAVIYAVYEARRRRGPRLAYQFTGLRVIGTRQDRLPTGVDIQFHGNSIKNLAQTQIVIWNKGDAPLRSTDVPAHDEIGFCFRAPCRVFLAEVSKYTREVNQVSVKILEGASDCVRLKFDFLDKEDGALISIWHSSHDVMPDVKGTVLGQKEGLISFGRFTRFSRNVSDDARASKSFEKLVFFVNRSKLTNWVMSRFPLVIVAMGIILTVTPFAYD